MLASSAAGAGYLYTLWHLNVPQTFFLQLTKQLSKPGYATSPSEIALENSIAKEFDRYMIDNAIQINPSQEAIIVKLDSKRPIARALKARIQMRQGEKAEAMMNSLPADYKIRLYLAQTAALAHAKRHDLVGAAKVLKAEEEESFVVHNRTAESAAEHVPTKRCDRSREVVARLAQGVVLLEVV